MNRVSVTIVDFMAVLVPGIVTLFGLVLLPIPDSLLKPLNSSLLIRIPLLDNPWAAGGSWLMSAYVLGFLLRLTSIDLMNLMTSYRWISRVQGHSEKLSGAIEEAIGDAKLAGALKAIAGTAADDRGVSKCAPYFQFAKRVLRTRPELWVEAERLEAEVRLAAGLFVPFFVLATVGAVRMVLRDFGAVILVIIGAIGATIVYRTFPERRSKEVLYVQLLALIALRQVAGQKTTMTAGTEAAVA
jgi:hypothetical protein